MSVPIPSCDFICSCNTQILLVCVHGSTPLPFSSAPSFWQAIAVFSQDLGDVRKSGYWWMGVSRSEEEKKKKEKKRRRAYSEQLIATKLSIRYVWLFALLGRVSHSSHLQKIRMSLLRAFQHVRGNTANFSLLQAHKNRKLIALIL